MIDLLKQNPNIPEYKEFQEQLEVFEYELVNSLAEIDPDEEDKETPWFGERFKEWLKRVDIALMWYNGDMIPLPIFMILQAWRDKAKDIKDKDKDFTDPAQIKEVCEECRYIQKDIDDIINKGLERNS